MPRKKLSRRTSKYCVMLNILLNSIKARRSLEIFVIEQSATLCGSLKSHSYCSLSVLRFRGRSPRIAVHFLSFPTRRWLLESSRAKFRCSLEVDEQRLFDFIIPKNIVRYDIVCAELPSVQFRLQITWPLWWGSLYPVLWQSLLPTTWGAYELVGHANHVMAGRGQWFQDILVSSFLGCLLVGHIFALRVSISIRSLVLLYQRKYNRTGPR